MEQLSQTSVHGQTHTFIAPSGCEFTIREQNGGDDDIISNPQDALTFMNFAKFIASLVIDTDATPLRKLTPEMAYKLPVLDKYAILFQSRTFSIGNTVDFDYEWTNELGVTQPASYEALLDEYLLKYELFYSEPMDEEAITNELNTKPDAIPVYPRGKATTNIEIITSSGKRLLFDCLDSAGEAFIVNAPVEQQTKNIGLIARNLRYKMGDNWIKVENFQPFSVKDMMEIRTEVKALDPTFQGRMEIENPFNPGQKEVLNILSLRGFFYPGEI